METTADILDPKPFDGEDTQSVLLWLQREYKKLMMREVQVKKMECVGERNRMEEATGKSSTDDGSESKVSVKSSASVSVRAESRPRWSDCTEDTSR